MPIHPDLVNKTSLLVQQQVPEFIATDHPKFVTFLEKYYEWMEQVGNSSEIIGNLDAYGDVDRTTTDFLKNFKKQYFPNILENSLVSKEFITKNVREFYRARGSEESFKILFRMLFDEEVTLSFPGIDILKVSDGKWSSETILKTIFDASGLNRLFDQTGRLVTGQTSGATGILESSIRFQEGPNTVVQYVLNQSSIRGTFADGETISGFDQNGDAYTSVLEGQLIGTTITNPGSEYIVGDEMVITGGGAGATGMLATVSEISLGIVDGVTITNGGTGYSVGDKLDIDNTGKFAALGRTASLLVKTVSGGVITAIEIENGGNNYRSVPLIDATTTGNGDAVLVATSSTIGGIVQLEIKNSGFKITAPPSIDATGSGDGQATITGQVGSVFNQPGRFLNSDGKLSEDKVIQDSFFYQDFSYVVNAEQSIDFWREQVKRVLHPAGMQLFGSVSINTLLDASIADFVSAGGGDVSPVDYVLSFPEGTGTSLDLQIVSTFINIALELTPLIDSARGLGMGLDYFHTMRNRWRTEGGLSAYTTTGEVTGVNITNGGTLYTTVPSVVFDDTGTGGTGAAGTAVINGGEVIFVTIDNPGSGYNIPPTMTFTGGDGSGATGGGAIRTDSGGTNITVYDNIPLSDFIDPVENKAARKRTRYTTNALIEIVR